MSFEGEEEGGDGEVVLVKEGEEVVGELWVIEVSFDGAGELDALESGLSELEEMGLVDAEGAEDGADGVGAHGGCWLLAMLGSSRR